MNRFTLLLLFILLTGFARSSAQESPRDGELVDVAAAVPGIRIDLRYATPDNFLKRRVYPVARCVLRRAVAEQLAKVQADLARRGLGLKIWDAYRPLAVQHMMWKILPDPDYVADPAKGSRHNRGAAIDCTLVDAAGRELTMPTAFDDFTPRAAADSPAASATARHHRRILQEAMTRHGFQILPSEWWHFDAPDWQKWPVMDVPLDDPSIPGPAK